MHRVLMNFQHRGGWVAHFLEADCRTPIGARTRFITFPGLEEFRAFAGRCTLEDPAELEADIRRWARGSAYCRLTDQQYSRLQR